MTVPDRPYRACGRGGCAHHAAWECESLRHRRPLSVLSLFLCGVEIRGTVKTGKGTCLWLTSRYACIQYSVCMCVAFPRAGTITCSDNWHPLRATAPTSPGAMAPAFGGGRGEGRHGTCPASPGKKASLKVRKDGPGAGGLAQLRVQTLRCKRLAVLLGLPLLSSSFSPHPLGLPRPSSTRPRPQLRPAPLPLHSRLSPLSIRPRAHPRRILRPPRTTSSPPPPPPPPDHSVVDACSTPSRRPRSQNSSSIRTLAVAALLHPSPRCDTHMPHVYGPTSLAPVPVSVGARAPWTRRRAGPR